MACWEADHNIIYYLKQTFFIPEKIFDSFLLHSQINQLVNLTHHVGLSNVDMKTP
jgi:hypothetical protein